MASPVGMPANQLLNVRPETPKLHLGTLKIFGFLGHHCRRKISRRRTSKALGCKVVDVVPSARCRSLRIASIGVSFSHWPRTSAALVPMVLGKPIASNCW